MRWIMLIVWTAFVAVSCSRLYEYTTEPVEYAGSVLEFKADTSRYLDLSRNAILMAASSDLFLLYKESGESVLGQPAEPPLGWEDDAYFVAGPVEIPKGRWIVEKGNPTVRLVSEVPMKVVLPRTSEVKSTSGVNMSISGFILWVLGVFVGWWIAEQW